MSYLHNNVSDTRTILALLQLILVMLYSVTFHPVIHPAWSNEQGLEVFMSLVIILLALYSQLFCKWFFRMSSEFQCCSYGKLSWHLDILIWMKSSSLDLLICGQRRIFIFFGSTDIFPLAKNSLSLSKNFMSITSQIRISRLLIPMQDLTWRGICMTSRTPHLGNKHIHTLSLALWLLYSLLHPGYAVFL